MSAGRRRQLGGQVSEAGEGRRRLRKAGSRLGQRAAGRARSGRPGGGARWPLLGPMLAGARLPAAPAPRSRADCGGRPPLGGAAFRSQFEVDALIGIPLSAGPAPAPRPPPPRPPFSPPPALAPLRPSAESTWCPAPAGPHFRPPSARAAGASPQAASRPARPAV